MARPTEKSAETGEESTAEGSSRILAGIDLRQPGYEMLVDVASRFGAVLGARLDLLFVLPPGSPEKLVESRRSALVNLLKIVPEELRGEPLCDFGAPVDVLARYSTRYEAMVVGPRAPSALERLLLGTIAARVIRKARCPVFVPRDWDVLTVREPIRLLVGVDLRRQQPHPLFDRALPWVRRLGGRIDVAFIDPYKVPYIANPDVRAAAIRDIEKARVNDKEALEALLAQVEPDHRGESVIIEGDPGSSLVELSTGYDFALVGALDRHGLGEFLLGSVAEYVVSHAKCSVLTVPSLV